MSFPSSMFDTRGLVKLGRFSEDELDFSSCWISLATKLAVSGIMDLLEDMYKYEKREITKKNLVCNLSSCLFTKSFCFDLVLKL